METHDLFRLANDCLHERVRKLDVKESVPFLCECVDDMCLGRVELPPEEYEGIRSQRNRYVILPGHAMTSGGRVVEDSGPFQVFENEHDRPQ